ncbi:hypothetical protein [Pseudomonas japonica]|uniref:hypothetical protein n=1 Tax=Pseudomonas japonica TaxID=256466 RepID=UPI0015E47960|nr:hypothetical protein [Pseudomonas japonica]MBA1289326.1 hypothetical protein [Pseudomonas japonica]
MLKGIWDFDSEISQTPDPANPTQFVTDTNAFPVAPPGVGKRAYYQSASFSLGDETVIVRGPRARWVNYTPATTLAEVPPLPPFATNSAVGGASGNNNKDAVGSVNFLHHLIRDFMFLDAARSDDATQGGTEAAVSQATRQFTAVRNDTALQAPTPQPRARYTRGTGTHAFEKQLLLSAVPDVEGNNLPFDLGARRVNYSALLYELQGNGAVVSPDWFGVAVPPGLKNFSSVVIYFHPTPSQALYADQDYPAKTSSGPNRADWKELFGYVDRLGGQLSGAVDQNPLCSQLVICPFMRQADVGTAGLLPEQWYFIVSDILNDVRSQRELGTLP